MKRWIVSSNYFYILIASFAIGVAFRSFFNLGQSFVWFFLLLSLAVILFNQDFIILALVFALFGLGILRMDLADNRDFILDGYVNSQKEVVGIIAEEPSLREKTIQLQIKINGSNEKILVITDRTDLFQYGDLVKIDGFINQPQNFLTNNNREFDYINYLSKDDIFYSMLFPKIEIIESGHGSVIRNRLFKLKNLLISKMNKVIGSPESEYLSGLIFGVKESLGRELEDNFRRTGLIHVVVLSGYNVTIVAKSILKVFIFLPQYAGLSLGIISIVLFALMTGASATIVRASIMAILAILASPSTRRYGITRALFLAGFLMILHNPKILLFDPSFQLSFLATIGLIHFSPVLEGKLKFLPKKFQIRELAASTLATQIFVLPLLLNKMGEMSLIAPIANLLVLPVIPTTMFFGFLTSIVGLASHFLSAILGAISFIFLKYQIIIVEFFASLPFASIQIKTFPLWLMFLVYLFYLWLYRQKILKPEL